MSIDLAKKEVRVSWRYPFPRETVFRAIAAGRLLITCGSKMDEFRHDFRVGGAWQFAYGAGGSAMTCKGTYLEIVPNERVAFTWNEGKDPTTGAPASSSESEVTATLTTKGGYTHLEIVHSKVSNVEWAHSFHQGWTEVLGLFLDELDGTTIRLAHELDAPASRVFQALAKGLLFRFTTHEADFKRGSLDFREWGAFNYSIGADDYVRGQFTKITPNQLCFTWSTLDSGVRVEESEVTIFLEQLGDKRTRLHLVHDGLRPAKVSESHESGWKDALKNFAGAV